MKKVLYIEDEPFLSRIVKETLEFRGYEVLHKSDGAEVLKSFDSFVPDVCILDVMLPHVDGFTLGRSIRHLFPRLPIIFLTAKSQTDDVLKGFSSGGTDYLKKPFSMEELMARIEIQIQWNSTASKNTPADKAEIISFGSFAFTPSRMELKCGNENIKLSNRETEILRFLLSNQHEISDRRDLLLAVWGDDSFFNSRNLDVYIRKIRDYLSVDPNIEIITLKGKGYRFLISKAD